MRTLRRDRNRPGTVSGVRRLRSDLMSKDKDEPEHTGHPIGGRDRSLEEPIRRPTKDETDRALGKKPKDDK